MGSGLNFGSSLGLVDKDLGPFGPLGLGVVVGFVVLGLLGMGDILRFTPCPLGFIFIAPEEDFCADGVLPTPIETPAVLCICSINLFI
jgi:hypothetical protein